MNSFPVCAYDVNVFPGGTTTAPIDTALAPLAAVMEDLGKSMCTPQLGSCLITPTLTTAASAFGVSMQCQERISMHGTDLGSFARMLDSVQGDVQELSPLVKSALPAKKYFGTGVQLLSVLTGFLTCAHFHFHLNGFLQSLHDDCVPAGELMVRSEYAHAVALLLWMALARFLIHVLERPRKSWYANAHVIERTRSHPRH